MTVPNLKTEVEEIKRDVRLLAAQVGGVPVRRAKAYIPREQVQHRCPNCGGSIVYKQRARMNSVKSVRCPQCEKRLYSRFGESGFILLENSEEKLTIQCPECKTQLPVH